MARPFRTFNINLAGGLGIIVTGIVVWVLHGGPQLSQVGAGTLFTQAGGTITTTRASGKFCQLADGGYTTLANNIPCVELNGLNTEGAATNLILRSQALATSPWGVAGSAPPVSPAVTNNTTDVTAPDGTSTATKIVFPATTLAEQFTLVTQGAITVVSGTTYTVSMWIMGTGAQTFHYSIDGSGFGPQTAKTCAVTAAWQRFSVTWTATGSGSGPQINIGSDTRAANANEAVQAAQTVYVWGAQMEARTWASSYIVTTAATASRASENNALGSITFGTAPSFSADIYNAGDTGTLQFLLEARNSGTDRWNWYLKSGGANHCEYFNGSAKSIDSAALVPQDGTKHHVSCNYDGANIRSCVDAACTSSSNVFTATSSTYTATGIGYDINGGSFPFFGNIYNICIGSNARACQ